MTLECPILSGSRRKSFQDISFHFTHALFPHPGAHTSILLHLWTLEQVSLDPLRSNFIPCRCLLAERPERMSLIFFLKNNVNKNIQRPKNAQDKHRTPTRPHAHTHTQTKTKICNKERGREGQKEREKERKDSEKKGVKRGDEGWGSI